MDALPVHEEGHTEHQDHRQSDEGLAHVAEEESQNGHDGYGAECQPVEDVRAVPKLQRRQGGGQMRPVGFHGDG